MCGRDTDTRYCPDDGVQTIDATELAVDVTRYQPGSIVAGRYRVERLLGRGGFGAVYEASHVSTTQPVALKLLARGDDSAGDELVRRFYKEARLTAGLSHPNTVRVFDVGQNDDGAFYLAMELLRGETLAARLRRMEQAGETMTDEAAAKLAIQVLRSLAEAHDAGLVHRDLKPANLMLCHVGDDEPALLKVLDFGCAWTAGSTMTGHGRALGTPAYMSPEQCAGEDLDGRCDLYALGVVLFRCITGRLPFADKNPMTLMYMHANVAPPDIGRAAGRSLEPALARTIETALAKDPRDRFRDARQMRAAIAAVAGVGGVATSSSTIPLVVAAEVELTGSVDVGLDGATWSTAQPIDGSKHAPEFEPIHESDAAGASKVDGAATSSRGLPAWGWTAIGAGAALAIAAFVPLLSPPDRDPVPADLPSAVPRTNPAMKAPADDGPAAAAKPAAAKPAAAKPAAARPADTTEPTRQRRAAGEPPPSASDSNRAMRVGQARLLAELATLEKDRQKRLAYLRRAAALDPTNETITDALKQVQRRIASSKRRRSSKPKRLRRPSSSAKIATPSTLSKQDPVKPPPAAVKPPPAAVKPPPAAVKPSPAAVRPAPAPTTQPSVVKPSFLDELPKPARKGPAPRFLR